MSNYQFKCASLFQSNIWLLPSQSGRFVQVPSLQTIGCKIPSQITQVFVLGGYNPSVFSAEKPVVEYLGGGLGGSEQPDCPTRKKFSYLWCPKISLHVSIRSESDLSFPTKLSHPCDIM